MKYRIRETKNFIRERQETPKHFIPSTFRVKHTDKAHELIVGKLKPQYRKKRHSNWALQSILTRK